MKRELAAMIVLATLGLGVAHSQTAGNHAPIRVACLDVYGTAERGTGPNNIQRCLSPSPDFTFRTITGEDIRSNILSQIDVLICPGGSGSKQSKLLDEKGRLAVQDFVRNGGGYLGFCAGAYLASSHYTWSLALLNARVVDTEHWARGMGDVTLKMTPEGRRLLGSTNESVTCYYGQGPLLAPGNHTNLPPYILLATYNSEIAKKNAPSGVMIGTTAIAMGTYGKGRVLCFSPHPEKTKGLEDFVRRAVRWTAGRD
ncbi:MAG: BPL-N domain-containing protein [Verrucomicrobiota bacterium]